MQKNGKPATVEDLVLFGVLILCSLFTVAFMAWSISQKPDDYSIYAAAFMVLAGTLMLIHMFWIALKEVRASK